MHNNNNCNSQEGKNLIALCCLGMPDILIVRLQKKATCNNNNYYYYHNSTLNIQNERDSFYLQTQWMPVYETRSQCHSTCSAYHGRVMGFLVWRSSLQKYINIEILLGKGRQRDGFEHWYASKQRPGDGDTSSVLCARGPRINVWAAGSTFIFSWHKTA